MSEKSSTTSLLWDRLGIGISGVCAIHCLILPAVIALLPLWSFATFLHDWLHPLFVVLVAPTIYFASKRSHFDRKITGLLVTGFLLIFSGWILGHFWLGHLFETILTVLGSIILISGHWLNYRHHQTCNMKKHNHHPVPGKENHHHA